MLARILISQEKHTKNVEATKLIYEPKIVLIGNCKFTVGRSGNIVNSVFLSWERMEQIEGVEHPRVDGTMSDPPADFLRRYREKIEGGWDG